MAPEAADTAGGSKEPAARTCEVCEHSRDPTFLQDLGGYDVCRWCVPAVLEGMQLQRRASGLGDAAFKRLKRLVSTLEAQCAELERGAARKGDA